MKVHAINTGFMSVKRNYINAKGDNRLMRLTSVLFDSRFQDIPVYTWLIEHPEGLILIDTGLSAEMVRPSYFPVVQRPYWLSQYRFKVRSEDEVASQLKGLGFRPEDVRWVVLTHTHFDHTGTIHDFPTSEFVITRKENDDTYRYRSAHFAFPGKWPTWFHPRVIDFVPEPIGPFLNSYPLTQARDVFLVPTPGHTIGQQAVVLLEDDRVIFFAADASFDLPSLLQGTMDAPTANAIKDMETRQKILDYSSDYQLVYLTTHDFETKNRLELRTPIRATLVPQMG